MNDRLLAQLAAYFLVKSRDVALTKLRVVKLMYLADRLSLERTGTPLSFDYPVSMEHGPVLSTTLNLMNGDVADRCPDGWTNWISLSEDNKTLYLKKDIRSSDELDELSEYDRRILDEVWEEFGAVPISQLYRYCHSLPEWEDPGQSSREITFERLLRELGITGEQAEDHISNILESRNIQ